MEIKEENYTVRYDESGASITCSGVLDLRGREGYAEIVELLGRAAESDPPSGKITLDMKNLEFLNSSGITTLGGFIIKLRKKGDTKLTILCSNSYSWQPRSMKGLGKLMPGNLEILFD
ncbi:MAG: hypothetical protein HQK66_08670 [Desulfamplus sp.]|nr:hypothetical protein [Desulfamplus sp.]